MHWFDAVVAVPSIGIRFEPWVKPGADILRDLTSTLTAWSRHTDVDVQSETLLELSIRRSDGFQVKIDTRNVVVQFSYQPSLGPAGDMLPSLSYQTERKRYSDLLETCSTLMSQVLDNLDARKRSPLTRIGVVMDCGLTRDEEPPGLKRFLGDSVAPWDQDRPLIMKAHVAAELVRNSEAQTVDQCHHIVDYSFEQADVNLRLDWQRRFEPPQTKTRKLLKHSMAETCKGAVAYFNQFGEGTYGSS